MEFFNEETIAYNGDQIFWESISRNFSKSTLVTFALKNFYIFSLQDDITRTASPKSSPYSSSSSIDFEQLPGIFERKGEKGPSSFAFAYDYSETTQLRSSSKSTGRRLTFSNFHNVSSCVWTCLNMFERVWICLNVFEHVWTCLDRSERVWTCMSIPLLVVCKRNSRGIM